MSNGTSIVLSNGSNEGIIPLSVETELNYTLTSEGHVLFDGAGRTAGETIEIFLSDNHPTYQNATKFLGAATVQTDGTWSLEVPKYKFNPGIENYVRTTVTEVEGNTSELSDLMQIDGITGFGICLVESLTDDAADPDYDKGIRNQISTCINNATEDKVLRFAVEGDIELTSRLNLGKNTASSSLIDGEGKIKLFSNDNVDYAFRISNYFNNLTISGLEITGFNKGIQIEGGDNIVIQGNTIYGNTNSDIKTDNEIPGLKITENVIGISPSNEIVSSGKNIIISKTDGVEVRDNYFGVFDNGNVTVTTAAEDVIIDGNYFQISPYTNEFLPNTGLSDDAAILAYSVGTQILNNVVAGNLDYGIWVKSSGVLVQGNFVGLDVSGLETIGSFENGINVQTVDGFEIIANTVAGASDYNINVTGSTNGEIKENRIGTDYTGEKSFHAIAEASILFGNSSEIDIVGNTINGVASSFGCIVAFENVNSGISFLSNKIGLNESGTALTIGHSNIANAVRANFGQANVQFGDGSDANRNFIAANKNYFSLNDDYNFVADNNYLGYSVSGEKLVSPTAGVEATASGSLTILNNKISGNGNVIDKNTSGQLIARANAVEIDGEGGVFVRLQALGDDNTLSQNTVSNAANYLSINSAIDPIPNQNKQAPIIDFSHALPNGSYMVYGKSNTDGQDGDVIEIFLSDDGLAAVNLTEYIGYTLVEDGAWSYEIPLEVFEGVSGDKFVRATVTTPLLMNEQPQVAPLTGNTSRLTGSYLLNEEILIGGCFVYNNSSSGEGSLDAAIQCANESEEDVEIVFTEAVGDLIYLTSELTPIHNIYGYAVTVHPENALTISGHNNVFDGIIALGTGSVYISNITLSNFDNAVLVDGGDKVVVSEVNYEDNTKNIALVNGGNGQPDIPEVPEVIVNGTMATFSGYTRANAEVEFYTTSSAGETYFSTITSLANGYYTVDFPVTDVVGKEFKIISIANGRTSEFSEAGRGYQSTACVVTTTEAFGEGSLDAAIQCANNQEEPVTIEFNGITNNATILVSIGSILTPITNPYGVTIAPDFNLTIRGGSQSVLKLQGNNSVIEGVDFDHATILISGDHNQILDANVIAGNSPAARLVDADYTTISGITFTANNASFIEIVGGTDNNIIDATADCMSSPSTESFYSGVEATNTKNLTIDNLTIRDAKIAIDLVEAVNPSILNSQIGGDASTYPYPSEVGIHLSNVKQGAIDNTVLANTTVAVELLNTSDYTVENSFFGVTSAEELVEGNITTGVKIHSYDDGGTVPANSHTNTVSGNVFGDVLTGVLVDGAYENTIDANFFGQNSSEVAYEGLSTGLIGVELMESEGHSNHSNVVSNNKIDFVNSTGSTYAVKLGSTSEVYEEKEDGSVDLSRSVVSGNEIENGERGVYIDHGDGYLIEGNILKDIADDIYLYYADRVDVGNNTFNDDLNASNDVAVEMNRVNDVNLYDNIIHDHYKAFNGQYSNGIHIYRNNVFEVNYGVQILFSSSDIEVYSNLFSSVRYGVQTSYTVDNVSIYDNEIILSDYSGGITYCGITDYEFHHNVIYSSNYTGFVGTYNAIGSCDNYPVSVPRIENIKFTSAKDYLGISIQDEVLIEGDVIEVFEASPEDLVFDAKKFIGSGFVVDGTCEMIIPANKVSSGEIVYTFTRTTEDNGNSKTSNLFGRVGHKYEYDGSVIPPLGEEGVDYVVCTVTTTAHDGSPNSFSEIIDHCINTADKHVFVEFDFQDGATSPYFISNMGSMGPSTWSSITNPYGVTIDGSQLAEYAEGGPNVLGFRLYGKSLIFDGDDNELKHLNFESTSIKFNGNNNCVEKCASETIDGLIDLEFNQSDNNILSENRFFNINNSVAFNGGVSNKIENCVFGYNGTSFNNDASNWINLSGVIDFTVQGNDFSTGVTPIIVNGADDVKVMQNNFGFHTKSGTVNSLNTGIHTDYCTNTLIQDNVFADMLVGIDLYDSKGDLVIDNLIGVDRNGVSFNSEFSTGIKLRQNSSDVSVQNFCISNNKISSIGGNGIDLIDTDFVISDNNPENTRNMINGNEIDGVATGIYIITGRKLNILDNSISAVSHGVVFPNQVIDCEVADNEIVTEYSSGIIFTSPPNNLVVARNSISGEGGIEGTAATSGFIYSQNVIDVLSEDLSSEAIKASGGSLSHLSKPVLPNPINQNGRIVFVIPDSHINYGATFEFFESEIDRSEALKFISSESTYDEDGNQVITLSADYSFDNMYTIVATATDIHSDDKPYTTKLSDPYLHNHSYCSVTTTSDDVYEEGDVIPSNKVVGDPVEGSLRSAIECANSASGDVLIDFRIPGDADEHLITINNGGLPQITHDGVTIDGSTQLAWARSQVTPYTGVQEVAVDDLIHFTNASRVKVTKMNLEGLEAEGDTPENPITDLVFEGLKIKKYNSNVSNFYLTNASGAIFEGIQFDGVQISFNNLIDSKIDDCDINNSGYGLQFFNCEWVTVDNSNFGTNRVGDEFESNFQSGVYLNNSDDIWIGENGSNYFTNDHNDVMIINSERCKVSNSYFSLDKDGNVLNTDNVWYYYQTHRQAILLENSHSTQIKNNVIVSHPYGIEVDETSSHTTIQGNIIGGLAPDGITRLASDMEYGISIKSGGVIGSGSRKKSLVGELDGANLIYVNKASGININVASSSDDLLSIKGNFLGVDAKGYENSSENDAFASCVVVDEFRNLEIVNNVIHNQSYYHVSVNGGGASTNQELLIENNYLSLSADGKQDFTVCGYEGLHFIDFSDANTYDVKVKNNVIANYIVSGIAFYNCKLGIDEFEITHNVIGGKFEGDEGDNGLPKSEGIKAYSGTIGNLTIGNGNCILNNIIPVATVDDVNLTFIGNTVYNNQNSFSYFNYKTPPTITSVSETPFGLEVSVTAEDGDFVEVFRSDEDVASAREVLGSTTLSGNSGSISIPYTDGELFLSAIATSPEGNSSDFSAVKEFDNSSLVLHYTFSETDGAETDHSIYENNYTMHDSPTFVADRHGNEGEAIYLDGVDDYLSIPADPSFQITEPFSLNVWFKLPEDPTERFSLRSAGSSQHYEGFDFSATRVGDKIKYSCALLDGSGAGSSDRRSHGFESEDTDDWINAIVVVSSFENGNADIRVYVNGVQKNVTTDGSGTSIGYVSPANDGLIGANFFTGVISEVSLDEVMIWNRALTTEEVENLFWEDCQPTVTREADFDEYAHNTLRKAIGCANRQDEHATISFDIAGAQEHVIAVQSQLPTFNNQYGITLDGTNADGGSVVIDGSELTGTEVGIDFGTLGYNIVQNVTINGFPGPAILGGIQYQSSIGNHIIQNCILSSSDRGAAFSYGADRNLKFIGNTVINNGYGLTSGYGGGNILVEGNYFGVNGGGNAFGNTRTAISFGPGSSSRIIGNTFGFNNGAISVGSASAEIIGNYIGVTVNGELIPNENFGVLLSYGGFVVTDNHIANTVMGTGAGKGLSVQVNAQVVGNKIYNNEGVGIYMSGSENSLYHNLTYDNGDENLQFEIGANHAKTPPVIDGVIDNHDGTYVVYGSALIGDYVELFQSDADDEVKSAEKVLGAYQLQGDATTWYINIDDEVVGEMNLVALATTTEASTEVDANSDVIPAGNTSDFSEEVYTLKAPCSFVVTHTGDVGYGSFRRAFECANASTQHETITFNIEGDQEHVINIESALPTFTNALGVDILGKNLGLTDVNSWEDNRVVLKLNDWSVSFSDGNDYSLKQLTVKRSSPLNKGLISFLRISNVEVSELIIENPLYDGLWFGNATGVIVNSNKFMDARSGIQFYSFDEHTTQNIRILNNSFGNLSYVKGPINFLGDVNDCKIKKNIIYNSEYGIVFDDYLVSKFQNIEINQNTLHNVKYQGVDIKGELLNVEISENYFIPTVIRTKLDEAVEGFAIDVNSLVGKGENVVIANNTINRPGIYLNSLIGATIKSNSLEWIPTLLDSKVNVADNGIHLNNSDNVKVTSNTLNNYSNSFIQVVNSLNTLVESNHLGLSNIDETESAILIASDQQTVLKDNEISNVYYGININNGSNGATLLNNSISNIKEFEKYNDYSSGIRVFSYVTNLNIESNTLDNSEGYGIYSSVGFVAENNKINNTSLSGIKVGNVIDIKLIFNSITNTNYGIEGNISGVIDLSNNIIDFSSQKAIYIKSTNSNCPTCKFNNNTVTGSGDIAVHLEGGSYGEATGNVIADNNSTGLYLSHGVSNSVFDDNTIIDNAGEGVLMSFGGTNNIIKNSTISRNGDVNVHFNNSATNYEFAKNTISGSRFGIIIDNSFNNKIYGGNKISGLGTDDGAGVWVKHSSSNHIGSMPGDENQDYNLIGNFNYGIEIGAGSATSATNNTTITRNLIGGSSRLSNTCSSPLQNAGPVQIGVFSFSGAPIDNTQIGLLDPDFDGGNIILSSEGMTTRAIALNPPPGNNSNSNASQNYLGLDKYSCPDDAAQHVLFGVSMSNCTSCIIGGGQAELGNAISPVENGSGFGVVNDGNSYLGYNTTYSGSIGVYVFESSGTVTDHNTIGVDEDGDRHPTNKGVYLGPGNTDVVVTNNTVVNLDDGTGASNIYADNLTLNGIRIEGNALGSVEDDGLQDAKYGVYLNQIEVTNFTDAELSVVKGNTIVNHEIGISIANQTAPSTLEISDNYIGTNTDGEVLGNSYAGLYVSGIDGLQIGTAANGGNTFANNGIGLYNFDAQTNTYSQNLFIDNVTNAIDNGAGANADIEAPTFSQVRFTQEGISFTAEQQGVVEIFISDESGSDASAFVNTMQNGSVFTATSDINLDVETVLASAEEIYWVSTLTDGLGNTSELSAPHEICLNCICTVTASNSQADGGLEGVISKANNLECGIINFELANPVVEVVSELPTLINPVQINGLNSNGENVLIENSNSIANISGLSLESVYSTVSDLTIDGFQTGVSVLGYEVALNNNVVLNSAIGFSLSGEQNTLNGSVVGIDRNGVSDDNLALSYGVIVNGNENTITNNQVLNASLAGIYLQTGVENRAALNIIDNREVFEFGTGYKAIALETGVNQDVAAPDVVFAGIEKVFTEVDVYTESVRISGFAEYAEAGVVDIYRGSFNGQQALELVASDVEVSAEIQVLVNEFGETIDRGGNVLGEGQEAEYLDYNWTVLLDRSVVIDDETNFFVAQYHDAKNSSELSVPGRVGDGPIICNVTTLEDQDFGSLREAVVCANVAGDLYDAQAQIAFDLFSTETEAEIVIASELELHNSYGVETVIPSADVNKLTISANGSVGPFTAWVFEPGSGNNNFHDITVGGFAKAFDVNGATHTFSNVSVLNTTHSFDIKASGSKLISNTTDGGNIPITVSGAGVEKVTLSQNIVTNPSATEPVISIADGLNQDKAAPQYLFIDSYDEYIVLHGISSGQGDKIELFKVETMSGSLANDVVEYLTTAVSTEGFGNGAYLWSIKVPIDDLNLDGPNYFAATATDKDGNTSELSDLYNFALTTCVVSTTDDVLDGSPSVAVENSLREAMEKANEGECNLIVFDLDDEPYLSGYDYHVIELENAALPEITQDNVFINGMYGNTRVDDRPEVAIKNVYDPHVDNGIKASGVTSFSVSGLEIVGFEYGVTVINSAYYSVRSMKIDDFYRSGIHVEGSKQQGFDLSNITNNSIGSYDENNPSVYSGESGIYASQAVSLKVSENYVTNCSRAGILINGSGNDDPDLDDGFKEGANVTSNIIDNCGAGATSILHGGIVLANVKNGFVALNEVYESSRGFSFHSCSELLFESNVSGTIDRGNTGAGVYMHSCHNFELSQFVASYNGEYGVEVNAGSDLKLFGNECNYNGSASSGDGIYINTVLSPIVLEYNETNGNADAGIHLGSSLESTIVKHESVGNEVGIKIDASSYVKIIASKIGEEEHYIQNPFDARLLSEFKEERDAVPSDFLVSQDYGITINSANNTIGVSEYTFPPENEGDFPEVIEGGNVISYNRLGGIEITAGSGNKIRFNEIFNNDVSVPVPTDDVHAIDLTSSNSNGNVKAPSIDAWEYVPGQGTPNDPMLRISGNTEMSDQQGKSNNIIDLYLSDGFSENALEHVKAADGTELTILTEQDGTWSVDLLSSQLVLEDNKVFTGDGDFLSVRNNITKYIVATVTTSSSSSSPSNTSQLSQAAPVGDCYVNSELDNGNNDYPELQSLRAAVECLNTQKDQEVNIYFEIDAVNTATPVLVTQPLSTLINTTDFTIDARNHRLRTYPDGTPQNKPVNITLGVGESPATFPHVFDISDVCGEVSLDYVRTKGFDNAILVNADGASIKSFYGQGTEVGTGIEVADDINVISIDESYFSDYEQAIKIGNDVSDVTVSNSIMRSDQIDFATTNKGVAFGTNTDDVTISGNRFYRLHESVNLNGATQVDFLDNELYKIVQEGAVFNNVIGFSDAEPLNHFNITGNSFEFADFDALNVTDIVGLRIGDSKYANIFENDFTEDGTTISPDYHHTGVLVEGNADKFVYDKNTFTNIFGYGVKYNFEDGKLITDHSFTETVIEGVQQAGLYLVGEGHQVEGSTINAISGRGIMGEELSNIVIEGNTITSEALDAVHLLASDYVQITNNVISEYGVDTYEPSLYRYVNSHEGIELNYDVNGGSNNGKTAPVFTDGYFEELATCGTGFYLEGYTESAKDEIEVYLSSKTKATLNELIGTVTADATPNAQGDYEWKFEVPKEYFKLPEEGDYYFAATATTELTTQAPIGRTSQISDLIYIPNVPNLFVVTTDEDGDVTVGTSLREVIDKMNCSDIYAVVDFSIPKEGPIEIILEESLPPLNVAMGFDMNANTQAFNQPEYSANDYSITVVKPSGENFTEPAGLVLGSETDPSLLTGLNFRGFENGISVQSSNHFITDLKVEGNGTGVGIDIKDFDSQADEELVSGLNLVGTTIDGFATGVSVPTSSHRIVSNTILNTEYGIHLKESTIADVKVGNVLVESNTIQSFSSKGILMEYMDAEEPNYISENIIGDPLAPEDAAGIGIYLINSNNQTIIGNQIDGIADRGNGAAGIMFKSYDDWVLEDNAVLDNVIGSSVVSSPGSIDGKGISFVGTNEASSLSQYNFITGNEVNNVLGTAVYIEACSYMTIASNSIGYSTVLEEETDLGGHGIWLNSVYRSTVEANRIMGFENAPGTSYTANQEPCGVMVQNTSHNNLITKNQIYSDKSSNDGINVYLSGNNGIQPPGITEFQYLDTNHIVVTGTGAIGNRVELFTSHSLDEYTGEGLSGLQHAIEYIDTYYVDENGKWKADVYGYLMDYSRSFGFSALQIDPENNTSELTTSNAINLLCEFNRKTQYTYGDMGAEDIYSASSEYTGIKGLIDEDYDICPGDQLLLDARLGGLEYTWQWVNPEAEILDENDPVAWEDIGFDIREQVAVNTDYRLILHSPSDPNRLCDRQELFDVTWKTPAVSPDFVVPSIAYTNVPVTVIDLVEPDVREDVANNGDNSSDMDHWTFGTMANVDVTKEIEMELVFDDDNNPVWVDEGETIQKEEIKALAEGDLDYNVGQNDEVQWDFSDEYKSTLVSDFEDDEVENRYGSLTFRDVGFYFVEQHSVNPEGCRTTLSKEIQVLDNLDQEIYDLSLLDLEVQQLMVKLFPNPAVYGDDISVNCYLNKETEVVVSIYDDVRGLLVERLSASDGGANINDVTIDQQDVDQAAYVMHEDLAGTNAVEYSFDLTSSGMTPGVYIARIYAGQMVQTVSFVVENVEPVANAGQ